MLLERWQAQCRDHCPGVKNLLIINLIIPSQLRAILLGSIIGHQTAQLSAALRFLCGAAAAMKPHLSSSALG